MNEAVTEGNLSKLECFQRLHVRSEYFLRPTRHPWQDSDVVNGYDVHLTGMTLGNGRKCVGLCIRHDSQPLIPLYVATCDWMAHDSSIAVYVNNLPEVEVMGILNELVVRHATAVREHRNRVITALSEYVNAHPKE